MDTLVSGKKGSGKTYYAVNHIYNLSKKEQAKVYHNIDGLELGNRIDDYCKEKGIDIITLFTESYHENNKELYDSLFVIDECQKIFPKELKNKDVFQFFQMGRHFNIDSMLLTQDQYLVSPRVTLHAELNLKAVPDVANPYPGFFVYREMSGSEKVGETKIRKKKKIFNSYKSSKAGKERKKIKPMQRIMFLSTIALVAIAFFGYRLISGMTDKEPSQAHTQQKERTLQRKEKDNLYKPKESSYSEYEEVLYPESHLKKIGGVLMPIDTLSDFTGTYVLLLGVPYPLQDFPYTVLKTRFGHAAVVPADLYQFQQDYKKEIILAGQFDPNAGGYYEDQKDKKDKEFNNFN